LRDVVGLHLLFEERVGHFDALRRARSDELDQQIITDQKCGKEQKPPPLSERRARYPTSWTWRWICWRLGRLSWRRRKHDAGPRSGLSGRGTTVRPSHASCAQYDRHTAPVGPIPRGLLYSCLIALANAPPGYILAAVIRRASLAPPATPTATWKEGRSWCQPE
jgi:hypothetical protein